MDTLLKRLLMALEENRYPPTPKGIQQMVLDLVPGENAEALAEKALEEARRRTKKALEGAWKAFALSFPPPGVERALLEGCHVTVWYSGRQSKPELHVWPQGEDKVCLPLTRRVPCRELLLNSRAGWVEVEVPPGLLATTSRAFLQAYSLNEVEEALQVVKALRPLFAGLDLEDLEGALPPLAGLEEGEARMEGSYVLARIGGSWFLRRGSLLGSPALDTAFLAGQEVKLAFPGGVDLTLRGTLSKNLVSLQEGTLRWEEEVLRFRSQGSYCGVLHERPISQLVRMGLWYEVEKPKRSYSPKMQALLDAVREEEDPLEALKDHGFLRKALLKVLSQV